MGHPWKKRPTEVCPECGKEFKFLAQHIRMAHGKEVTKSNKGGEEVTQEKDTEDVVKKVLADEKRAEEAAKKEESEKSGMAESIKGIGDRLDKMDADFCSKFPELCETVSQLKEAMPKKLEEGSEEWQAERRAGLDHILFDECPTCTPLRDEVLSAKGKRLADVEAEAKVDKAADEQESKVDEAEAKVDEKPELKTSPGYFPGSKWDEEKELYVEVSGG